jgi:glycosyltransferase involved in cell wall biosynthesis
MSGYVADAHADGRVISVETRDANRMDTAGATSAAAPRIVISNGFSRFPLAHLAAELRKHYWDVELLTGAYPTGLGSFLRYLPGVGPYRAGRLEDRRVDIDPERVHADFVSELVYKAGMTMASRGLNRLGLSLAATGFRLAGKRASRPLRRATPVDAYHVRSAFGLDSLKVARRHGITIVCDHSIVHPAALRPLLRNSGKLPAGGIPGKLEGLERLMLQDVNAADWVIVNSDFVRDTFEWAGFDMARVKVIYAGVETEFLDALPTRDFASPTGALRLLFAGEVGVRKGADVLFTALSALRDVDWRLDLVGSITPGIAAGWERFLGDNRVSVHGSVRIGHLAELMSSAEVFVFPSLAEGSARVVSMAMAAGCYVITTPNSGSIVHDGIHGSLIPPGDPDRLVVALNNAATHQTTLSSIGRANGELVRREYLVEHYANRVVSFYEEILDFDSRG